jgi:hypothetical protein
VISHDSPSDGFEKFRQKYCKSIGKGLFGKSVLVKCIPIMEQISTFWINNKCHVFRVKMEAMHEIPNDTFITEKNERNF